MIIKKVISNQIKDIHPQYYDQGIYEITKLSLQYYGNHKINDSLVQVKLEAPQGINIKLQISS
jgi:hypothetical protein